MPLEEETGRAFRRQIREWRRPVSRRARDSGCVDCCAAGGTPGVACGARVPGAVRAGLVGYLCRENHRHVGEVFESRGAMLAAAYEVGELIAGRATFPVGARDETHPAFLLDSRSHFTAGIASQQTARMLPAERHLPERERRVAKHDWRAPRLMTSDTTFDTLRRMLVDVDDVKREIDLFQQWVIAEVKKNQRD